MKRHLVEAITAIIILFTVTPCMAARRVVVFGLDETGSYSFRKKAIGIARSVIIDLAPGDTFYLRRITDKSYLDSCAVFRLSIPGVIEEPKNKFDRRSRAAWLKSVRQASEAKTKAIDILSNLSVVKSPGTDIFGFFAAASDRFQIEEDRGPDKIIIIASDMKDNCNLKTAPDLAGAEVQVVGFETGEDPVKTQQIRKEWTEILEKYNAKKVRFLPVDNSLAIKSSSYSKGGLSHGK